MDNSAFFFWKNVLNGYLIVIQYCCIQELNFIPIACTIVICCFIWEEFLFVSVVFKSVSNNFVRVYLLWEEKI